MVSPDVWSPIGPRIPLWLLTSFAVFLALAPAHAEEPKPLSEQERDRINRAIRHGTQFLRESQGPQGAWGSAVGAHAVGYTALPALTLLECGARADDPAIKKAAALVRKVGPSLKTTYELSLAVLFLDRLGDKQDEHLIQVCALRLIAGQAATGGWGYDCPLLDNNGSRNLLIALRNTEPPASRLFEIDIENPDPLQSRPVDIRDLPPTPRSRPFNPKLDGDVAKPDIAEEEVASDLSLRSPRFSPCLRAQEPPPVGMAKVPEEKQPARYIVPANLRGFTVFKDLNTLSLQDPRRRAHQMLQPTTDNSNTQFAILALWAARRHDVPLSRTLQLMVRRFETSQQRRWELGLPLLLRRHRFRAPPSHERGRPSRARCGPRSDQGFPR